MFAGEYCDKLRNYQNDLGNFRVFPWATMFSEIKIPDLW